MSPGLESLLSRKLLITAGKGGTGRSTLAACLAVAASMKGKRVLVLDSRPGAFEASRMLSSRRVGPDPEQVGERLWAAAMDPRAALREYVNLKFKFDFVYSFGFDNRFARSFLKAIPGLDDLLLLGKALHHVRQRQPGSKTRRFDLVVLDGPATGHAVPFLKIPELILDAVARGPIRGEARWMQDLLCDPEASSIVLVTVPEEVPCNETAQLLERLKSEVKIGTPALFVNRVIQKPVPRSGESLFEMLDAVRSRAPSAARTALEAARWSMSLRRRQMRELGRLKKRISMSVFELPELGGSVECMDDLKLLSRHLLSGRGGL